jgi:O-antigen/teichoic acid export membrane protein
MTTILSEDASSETMFFADEPLKNKLLRNWFWLYFFSFLVAPAGYLIKVMVSRTLSVEDIGIVYSIIGLMSILSSYNDLWLTEALQYYLPHYLIDKAYDKAKTLLVFTRSIQLLSGLLVGGILFFLAPRLSVHYFHHAEAGIILRYFCFYFLIINFFQVLQTIFVSLQYVKLYNWVDLVRMWSIVALTAYGIYSGSLSSLHLAQYWIIWVAVGTLFGFVFFRKKIGRLITKHKFTWDKVLLKKQRQYAFRVLLWANAWVLLAQIDQQFALYFLGAQSAWYWTNYLTLQTAVGVFTGPIIGYLFPLLNELYKKKEYDKIKHLKKLLVMWTLVFGAIVWIVWWLWWPQIAVLFFGERFRISWELFHYIAPFTFLSILSAINFQHLASSGMIKERVKILCIGVGASVILGLVLLPLIGIKGLLVSNVLGWILLLTLTSYSLRKIA